MIRKVLEVLNLLLTIEHLPALDAQDLAVRFLLDGLQSVDEAMPLSATRAAETEVTTMVNGSGELHSGMGVHCDLMRVTFTVRLKQV